MLEQPGRAPRPGVGPGATCLAAHELVCAPLDSCLETLDAQVDHLMREPPGCPAWKSLRLGAKSPRASLLCGPWSEGGASPQQLFARQRGAGVAPFLALGMARLHDALTLAQADAVFCAFDASPRAQGELVRLVLSDGALSSALCRLPRAAQTAVATARWAMQDRPSGVKLLTTPWPPRIDLVAARVRHGGEVQPECLDVCLLEEVVRAPALGARLGTIWNRLTLRLLGGLSQSAKRRLIERLFEDIDLAGALTCAGAQQLTMDLRPAGDNIATFVAFSQALASEAVLPTGAAMRPAFDRIDVPSLASAPGVSEDFEVHGRTVHLSSPHAEHLAIKYQKARADDDLRREARMGILFAGLKGPLGLASDFARPLGLLAAPGAPPPQVAREIEAAGITLRAAPEALLSALPPDYHLNILHARSVEELGHALRVVCHDQGRVAGRHGLFCRAPADLFHNCEHGERRWHFNVDALGHAAGWGRRGAGRLERVLHHMRHSNLGLRQLRDLKHYTFVEELLLLRDHGSGEDRPAYPSARLACTSLMGDWLLTCALVVGIWHRQRHALAAEAQMAQLVRSAFVAYFAAFTGRPRAASARFLGAVVKWPRLAHQMRVCLQPEGFTREDLEGMVEACTRLTVEEGTRRWESTPGEPDLGPRNGPFPLPALIEALFVVTDFAVELRQGSSAEGEAAAAEEVAAEADLSARTVDLSGAPPGAALWAPRPPTGPRREEAV